MGRQHRNSELGGRGQTHGTGQGYESTVLSKNRLTPAETLQGCAVFAEDKPDRIPDSDSMLGPSRAITPLSRTKYSKGDVTLNLVACLTSPPRRCLLEQGGI